MFTVTNLKINILIIEFCNTYGQQKLSTLGTPFISQRVCPIWSKYYSSRPNGYYDTQYDGTQNKDTQHKGIIWDIRYKGIIWDIQHHAIQNNSIQHNDTRRDDTKHEGIIWDIQYTSIMTFSTTRCSITTLHLSECRYAECSIFFIVIQNVIMLRVIVLNVVTLNVIRLS